MLSKEQSKQIKEQLLKQIESFPKEQKESAKAQIEAMSEKELEEFIKKNNLVKQENQETPFRLIIEGKIKSYKITENEGGLAVLEINPISKAHTIIIPKKPSAITEKVKELEKQLTESIAYHLKPKNIQVTEQEVLGEKIINIIPIYTNETPESERKQADEKELEELQKILTKPIPKEKPKPIKPAKLEKAPKRIP